MVKETYLDGGNGMGALSVAKPFPDEIKLNFDKAAAQNSANSDIYLRYPFPPASCDEALTVIEAIKADIKIENEKIASGANKRVALRYIDAYNKVLGDFQKYAITNKCEKAVLAAEDAAWTDQWQNILDKEQAQTSGVNKSQTWIILSVLGVLVIGTVIIILKKKKK